MNTVQVKTSFGGWKEVSIDSARKIVQTMREHGATKAGINSNHLRGITVDELIHPEPPIVPHELAFPSFQTVAKIETFEQDKDLVDTKDCTVEIELLARKEAFYRFEQNVLSSLMVWQLDSKVRESLPTVKDWVRDCIKQLKKIFGDYTNG